MAVKLAPGEQVRVRTRSHPRALTVPVIRLLLVAAATGYLQGLLARPHEIEALVQARPWLVTVVWGLLLSSSICCWRAARCCTVAACSSSHRALTRKPVMPQPAATRATVSTAASALRQKPVFFRGSFSGAVLGGT